MKSTLVQMVAILFSLGLCAQSDVEKKQLASEYYKKGVAFRYAQKDSAYHYLDKAFKYSYELADYSNTLEIIIQTIFISGQYSDMKKNRSSLEEMGALLRKDSVKNSLEYLEYYQNRLIYEKGSYLFTLKDYEGAKSQFLKVYRALAQKQIPLLEVHDLLILVHTANFLASVYMDTGKYDLAENYFNRSLAFVSKNKLGIEEGLDLSTNRLLAQLYVLTGKYARAHTILEKLLDGYKVRYNENTRYKNSLITVFQRSVNNLIHRDSLNKALAYLDESQDYMIDDDPFFKHSLLLYGDIYSKLGKEALALENYKKALMVFSEFRQNEPHQDLAKVHGKIAELYLKQNQYKNGLKAIQRAFNTSGNNIQIRNERENPNPDDVFSITQLLNLLDIKLQLLQGAYDKVESIRLQEAALKTCNDILKTFDHLKSEFDSKLDKQFLAEKAYPIFHRMLQTAYSAYQKDRSPKTLQLALNIGEKNKDFLLLEALRSSQATRYGKVPQEVLDQEAQLRAEITYVEKQIFDASDSDSDFSGALFTLKQEYYNFLDTIKSKYPEYHDLKYRTEYLDLATIRDKLLDDGGTLVSYTMTDEYLFAIVLNVSGENFLKLPFSEADRKSVREFYKLLSNPSVGGSQNEIARLGKGLYAKILKKILQGTDSQKLTIIPDGELHYLPFDMLRQNESYLLRTKSIGYGNSVASLLELKKKKAGQRNKVMAFAPSFTGVEVANADRQFGRLRYNNDEVSKIGMFFDTKIFENGEATLANFKKKTSRFNILHLATHASANDEYPDYSYLAFTEEKDSTESNILYIKDLYNISLNADLVTLSACQTGIGKLQKGQGMLSLSKGFYYAGAKSLVNTLWKINDKSTVKLMDFFYEGLSEGKSKTAALRDAKLQYLATTDDDLLRQPYYWAAFVVSGDASPITETQYGWYVGAGMLFFVVLFFIYRGKRKIKGLRSVALRTTS